MEQPSPYVSTVQAAQAIGVSVSTVKRWVDEGVLPAHRTVGGHRKLLRAEVLALARSGALPRGDLAALGPLSKSRPQRLDVVEAELFAALVSGDGTVVTDIVHRAYQSGISIEDLADRLISPVMARIGHDWETDRIDVWQEHRATQLCAAALYDLKDRLDARAEQRRPVAVGGAPEGDPYLLATLLAQYVLLDAGWDATNLGPNTPIASMIKAIQELRPKLFWLSVSHLADANRFVQEYGELYRAAQKLGAAVAVGGQALSKPIRTTIPYTTYGDGLTHLASFAQSLHPRPKPPQRGRPRSRSSNRDG